MTESSTSVFHTIWRPEIWKPFVIVCCLQSITILSCMKMFHTYILKMFEDKVESSAGNFTGTNIDDANITFQVLGKSNCTAQPYVVGIIYGSFRTVSSLFVTFLIGNHRRRIIYLISGTYD